MDKINISGINENYYYEKLNNGLQVYIFPNRNKRFKVFFMTKFGGLVKEFKTKEDKKFYDVPPGIAHFIEHQLFQQKNGKSISDQFEKLTISINAHTSYDYTNYVISGRSNFKKGLINLLDFVQMPNFSDKGTEKEKGIICEEIRIRKNKVNFLPNLVENNMLFHYYPIKYDIAGDEEDIMKIKTKDLQYCYDNFYHPSQMILLISSNTNPQKIIEYISENQLAKKFNAPKNIEIKKYAEPESVVEKYKLIKHNVEQPEYRISFKMSLDKFKHLEILNHTLCDYIEIIILNNFGLTSEISQYLLEKDLIINQLKFSVSIYDDYLIIQFVFRSFSGEEVIEALTKKIKNLELDEKIIEIYKKTFLSDFIINTEFSENLLNIFINLDTIGVSFQPNYYNQIKDMNIGIAQEIIKSLDFSNKTQLVIKPLNDN